MKFKEVPPKNNLILMFFIMVTLTFISIGFLILKKYYYFIIYILFTVLLIYFYLFTYYVLEKEYILIKSGFLKIKIKYSDINNLEESKASIKIISKKIKYILYPDKKDKFMKEINNNVDFKVIGNGE